MPGTTTRGAFRYPLGTEPPDTDGDMRRLAEDVDGKVALFNDDATRPAAGVRGRLHRDPSTGVVTWDTGSAWTKVSGATLRIPHTFTISGEVKVPSGDEFYIPPFFVPVPAGQTVTYVASQARARINSGTSVMLAVSRNGTDFNNGDIVTTTSATLFGNPQSFANGDLLALRVIAVTGTPKNLTVTIPLDYTV